MATSSRSRNMTYEKLGKSEQLVSRICFGCMAFGDSRGGNDIVTEEADALPLLQEAHQAGITFFATSGSYSNGVADEILGKAIRSFQWSRKDIVIATKVHLPVGKCTKNGVLNVPLRFCPELGLSIGNIIDNLEQEGHNNEFGLSRKQILASVDASLIRLGLDYIDLLQIHRFDPLTPVEETMEALHDIVGSGKVRFIGASALSVADFRKMNCTARKYNWTELISIQSHHSAYYREEELNERDRKKLGMGMITFCPVAHVWLACPHQESFKTPYTNTTMDTFSDDASSDDTSSDDTPSEDTFYSAQSSAKDDNMSLHPWIKAQVEEIKKDSCCRDFLWKEWTDADRRINERIKKIGDEKDLNMFTVAIAWSLSKPCVTSVIVKISDRLALWEALDALVEPMDSTERTSINRLYKKKNVVIYND